jgi:hypothetical protein
MYLTIFSNQFEVGFQDDRSAKDTFNGTRKVCFCWLTISHKLLKKKKKKKLFKWKTNQLEALDTVN